MNTVLSVSCAVESLSSMKMQFLFDPVCLPKTSEFIWVVTFWTLNSPVKNRSLILLFLINDAILQSIGQILINTVGNKAGVIVSEVLSRLIGEISMVFLSNKPVFIRKIWRLPLPSLPPSLPPAFCLPASLWHGKKAMKFSFQKENFPLALKKGVERIQSMCNSVTNGLAWKDADEASSDS